MDRIDRYRAKAGEFGTADYLSVDAEKGEPIDGIREDLIQLFNTLLDIMKPLPWSGIENKKKRIKLKEKLFNNVKKYMEVR